MSQIIAFIISLSKIVDFIRSLMKLNAEKQKQDLEDKANRESEAINKLKEAKTNEERENAAKDIGNNSF